MHRETAINEGERKIFLDEYSLKEDEPQPSTWWVLERILENEKKDKHIQDVTQKSKCCSDTTR